MGPQTKIGFLSDKTITIDYQPFQQLLNYLSRVFFQLFWKIFCRRDANKLMLENFTIPN